MGIVRKSTMTENRLLKRQLKKAKIRSFDDLDEESFQHLLQLVARSYNDYEEDKSLYENVAELASQEFQGLNESLERKVEELEKINALIEKLPLLYLQIRKLGVRNEIKSN